MSMIIPGEGDRTDPDGRPLAPYRRHDSFRYRAVWAVYRFQSAHAFAEARCSEFVNMANARETADNFNRARVPGQTYYFRVYRLACGEHDSKRKHESP